MSRTIAKARREVSWTAPSGLKVIQRYAKPTGFRVRTLAGRVSFQEPGDVKARPDPRKAASSSAPNVVHSFDAAHLVAVVNNFDAPLAAIHDSLGSHANHVGQLAQVCRDTFAEQYAVDHLARLDADRRDQHPDLAEDFPLLPPRGSLDVSACRESGYLFS